MNLKTHIESLERRYAQLLKQRNECIEYRDHWRANKLGEELRYISHQIELANRRGNEE
jgi:hypothetical protein